MIERLFTIKKPDTEIVADGGKGKEQPEPIPQPKPEPEPVVIPVEPDEIEEDTDIEEQEESGTKKDPKRKNGNDLKKKQGPVGI